MGLRPDYHLSSTSSADNHGRGTLGVLPRFSITWSDQDASPSVLMETLRRDHSQIWRRAEQQSCAPTFSSTTLRKHLARKSNLPDHGSTDVTADDVRKECDAKSSEKALLFFIVWRNHLLMLH
jgi:hypothetical protein